MLKNNNQYIRTDINFILLAKFEFLKYECWMFWNRRNALTTVQQQNIQK